MIRFLLVLAFSFISSVAIAKDSELSDLPLKRLFYKYDHFLELNDEEKNLIKPIYEIESDRTTPENVRFNFSFGEENFEFSPQEDGLVSFFPTVEMYKANPTVYTNQEKGTLSVSVSIGVNIPNEKQYDMSVFYKRVKEAWAVTKGFAGGMRIFGSKHPTVSVLFDDDCANPLWTVRKGDSYEKEYDGSDAIKLGKKEIRNSETISFSCKPTGFIFG